MNDSTIEHQFRSFLVWVSIFIFAGTLLELFLLEHYEENIQYLPFILSIIGILVLITAWFKQTKATILTMRWFMVIVGLGSLVGIYFHLYHDMAVIQYKNPAISSGTAFWQAVLDGLPLIAPGVLFLAGILGIAATYKHPKLKTVNKARN